MSTKDDTHTKGTTAHTVITDPKGLPVTVDTNAPSWYAYVFFTMPLDVARVTGYCLAAPLSLAPSAYRAVLGIGSGRPSFFSKTVSSINAIRHCGLPFLLLASAAVG